ncbi:MAG: formyltransferase family protein [bacterium]
MNIVLFSSGYLASEIAQFLIQQYKQKVYNSFYLVTKPDKPKGRGLRSYPNIIKKTILEILPSFQNNILEFDSFKKIDPSKKAENIDQLRSILSLTDIAICCDLGLIIPSDWLGLPKIFINIHPSLLPLYRGPSPIQYTLLNGDSLTGITICLVSEKVDQGDIICQSVIKIDPNDNFLTLRDKLSMLALEELKKFIYLYNHSRVYFIKQNDSISSYTRKINDTLIDLSKSVIEVHNQVRAFYPDGYIYVNLGSDKKRIKILKTAVVKNDNFDYSKFRKMDIFWIYGKRIFIGKEGENNLLEVFELQLEGRKVMDAGSFINGYQRYIN